MPRTVTTAAPAISVSPASRRAPSTASSTPRPTSTTPATGERRLAPRSPRRPASTATTSWREAIQAGTTAARKALRRPSAAIAARCDQWIWNGPNQESERACRNGTRATLASPMPSTMPTTPEKAPTTRAAPRTTRLDWAGVPPLAEIRARLRDCRRAPTANAGPARSTTSISAITAIRMRTV